jgi:hypothetical protein|tara:strand:+ start:91 stop:540 length:450 start_codon:yes stop_codon:yes gene_type:complete
MAHFAKISEDNVVLQVVVIADANTVNESDVETESVGQAYLEQHCNWPANRWIKTSYNTSMNQHKLSGTAFRGNYAAIGMTWDSSNNIFWPPKPFTSWTKNTTTAQWESPAGAEPSLNTEQQNQNAAQTHLWEYTWNESTKEWDFADEYA